MIDKDKAAREADPIKHAWDNGFENGRSSLARELKDCFDSSGVLYDVQTMDGKREVRVDIRWEKICKILEGER